MVGTVALVSCGTTGQKTLTRGQFRSDLEKGVVQFDGKFEPDCESRTVVDTEFLEKYTNGTWSERWTVNRCGKLISYKLDFLPQPDGVAEIKMKMEH